MYCPKCGAQVDNTAKFCGYCATNLTENSIPSASPINFQAGTAKTKKPHKGMIIAICLVILALIGVSSWIIIANIPSAEKTVLKCMYADRNMKAQEYVETLYGANFKIGKDPSEYLEEYIVYYANKKKELGTNLQKTISSTDYKIISSEQIPSDELKRIIENRDDYHYEVSGITAGKRVQYMTIHHHDDGEDTYETDTVRVLLVNGKWYVDY